MAQTSISIRMDAELKKNFETFCGADGRNMSTAINMFAIACVREQRVPFEISAQRALPGESLDLFTDTTWSDGENCVSAGAHCAHDCSRNAVNYP